MDVRLTFTGNETTESGGDDDLLQLQDWLVGEADLRGVVRTVEHPPTAGTMGGWLEALVISVAPGGAAVVLASSLISWVQSRRGGAARVVLRLPDGAGEFEVSARRVRDLDGQQLGAMVEQLAQFLTDVARPIP